MADDGWKIEYGVVRNGAIVSLGAAVGEAGARAYAKQQGLRLVWRRVGEWADVEKARARPGRARCSAG